MKYFLVILTLLCIVLPGCSQNQESKTSTDAQPTKPAEVKSVASGSDITLMAEYLVFTHLADSLIYKPMNDTAAMLRLVSQIDMTASNVSTTMTRSSLKYLHSIYSNALLPLQQFAGSARAPEIKRMAEEFTTELQQIANQSFRAVKILEQDVEDDSRADQMAQVGRLLQGNTMDVTKLRLADGNRAAIEAAYRALGR